MFDDVANSSGYRLSSPPRFPDVRRGTEWPTPYLDYMAPGTATAAYDRVIERRRAVALAHHFRAAEALSIKQIADRLGRSPATVKDLLLRPV
jgi:AraC-like DNA-binding protein